MATCENISLTPQGEKVYTGIVCIELLANIREKRVFRNEIIADWRSTERIHRQGGFELSLEKNDGT